MSISIAIIRLGLSIVFGVAGIAKLLDQRGTREAVINFGAPAGWSQPLAMLLAVAEIAIAAGLLFSATAWVSAMSAILLLSIFIIAISLNLYRGYAPDCHCFGQLYSRPLGWSTLIRNLGFGLAAAFIAWQRPQMVGSNNWQLSRFAAELYFPLLTLPASLIVVITVIVFRRGRSTATGPGVLHNHPAPAMQGLPLDVVAPTFKLPAYGRDQTSLAELLKAGRPLLLIFSNPNCGPCAALFAELAQWQRKYPERVTIAVLTQGTVKENFVNIARNDLQNILFQNQREVAELYQCSVTPTGVLVSAAGRIASAPAPGADKIRDLLHSTLENQGHVDAKNQIAV
jgi:hypothetical protein